MEVAAFWPLLCPDGRHLAPFFHAWHVFPFFNGMFLPGRSGSNIGNSLTDDSLVLACYFDFSAPDRLFNAGFCLHNASGYCNKLLCSGLYSCYIHEFICQLLLFILKV